MVLEDDPDVAKAISRKLGADGHDAELQSEPHPVLARLDSGEDWDVVLLDVGLPGMSGIDVLHRFREANSLASIIMLTGDNTATTAATCMRAGAFYYLTKPFRPFELSSMVESAARYSTLRRQLRGVQKPVAADSLLVGMSAEMRKLRLALERLAGQDVSVLIRGESGTGKELVARTLHLHGERSKKKFVPLNCGAIPETLIDSELFGHAKGAFTDAKTARTGLVPQADGGTLFLDEIADLPLAVQPKLLRVLQERRVRPVGAEAEVAVDVRVVAATNRDLEAMVAAREFREDLYYRINVVHMPLPPLRVRSGDVLLLAQHFLEHFARMFGRPVTAMTPEVGERLVHYAWPGNVRELRNAIERGVAMAGSDKLTVEDLPEKVRGYRQAPEVVSSLPVDLTLEELERMHILRVLESKGGNKLAAAAALDIDRKTLYRKLQRYGVEGDS
jgi:two-component system response regulator HydG